MKGTHIYKLCNKCGDVEGKHYVRKPRKEGGKGNVEPFCISCVGEIKRKAKAKKEAKMNTCWEGYHDCASFNVIGKQMMCK